MISLCVCSMLRYKWFLNKMGKNHFPSFISSPKNIDSPLTFYEGTPSRSRAARPPHTLYPEFFIRCSCNHVTRKSLLLSFASFFPMTRMKSKCLNFSANKNRKGNLNSGRGRKYWRKMWENKTWRKDKVFFISFISKIDRN